MTDPRQTEMIGADDFNLVAETVTDWTPPPPPDPTLELPLE
jgi:hypothetical protein